MNYAIHSTIILIFGQYEWDKGTSSLFYRQKTVCRSRLKDKRYAALKDSIVFRRAKFAKRNASLYILLTSTLDALQFK